MSDASELLTEVNAAIEAIAVGGQSYKIGTRSLTRANLSELITLRDKLTAETAAETSDLFDHTSIGIFTGR